MDSCPILVIVERETPDATHTRHVGKDTYCPHARAAHAWPGGPASAAMAYYPTLHGWCPPQDARPHAPCPRWRHVWLCGLGFCGDRCRRTATWRLGLPLSGSPQEATAEQIEVGPPKHLTFQYLQAV